MSNTVMILGLKKAAIVLHQLATSFKEQSTRDETMALVTAIHIAIDALTQKAGQQ